MGTQELRLIDRFNEKHDFAIAPKEAGGKLIQIENTPWEPTDPALPWRSAIHPWHGGLAGSRIEPRITFSGDLKNRPSMVYAKSSGDASNDNYLTAPPKMNELMSFIDISFLNEAAELEYNVFSYGTVTYMGPATSTSPIFIAVKNFNGNAYFGGGQYLYKVDSNMTLTVVKDFGAGVIIHAVEPFDNELVIALGESDNIWVMDTAEAFTEGDAQAIALAAVGELLWRAKSTHLLSNAIEDPELDASYVPVAGAEYPVGNGTYPVTDLREFAGVVVAFTADGVWFPDSETVFYNQAPQMSDYPDPDNGKGNFVAGGDLYAPSAVGLLQINLGQAIAVGPEKSKRPDFRFRIRAGIEWNDAIYVLATDEAGIEETFICKMVGDNAGLSENPFVYHEWRRLGSVAKGYALIVYTEPTNPTMIAGHDVGLKYWKLGRGGGPDVDDPNYEFETEYELESGDMMVVSDLAVKIDLTGVKITGKQPLGSTLRVFYSFDRSGIWTEMRTNPDGTGVAPITSSGYFSETRYAIPNEAIGHKLQIRLVATIPSGIFGVDRPEIEEVWAFGNAIPDSTDAISCGIIGDRKVRIRGLRRNREVPAYERCRKWKESGEILLAYIPEYAADEPVRVKVIGATETNINMMKDGTKQVPTSIIQLTLRRVDYSGDLNGE